MTLKTQLINHLRYSDGWECGADLERMEWETARGGIFKPSTVGRELRRLEEEERLEKREDKTVFYRYRHNEYERLHYKLNV